MIRKIEGFILSGQSIDLNNQLQVKLYGQSDAGSFLIIANQNE